MTIETPADILRRAANLMRERAQAATNDGWDEAGHVTSVHEPAEPYDGENLIIGCGKDHYDAEDSTAWTSKQYIADAEEESFAAHIAPLSPPAVSLITDLWMSIASDIDEGHVAPTTHHIAVVAARAYLGEAK